MNIIFENIEINNFLAIQHAKFNLKNNGFVLINGINNNKDDNAKSNGAGKSALFEALIYCLTGETSRGAKDKDVVKKAFDESDYSVDKCLEKLLSIYEII